jgi:hypothetical protein
MVVVAVSEVLHLFPPLDPMRLEDLISQRDETNSVKLALINEKISSITNGIPKDSFA